MAFSSDLWGQIPGFTAARETYANAIGWDKAGLAVIQGGQIDGTARDAGASPTTILRTGLLLGRLDSNGNLLQYSDTATDGTDEVVGCLLSEFRMQDNDGNNVNRWVWFLAAGPVMGSKLYGLTEQARAQMCGRFLFDDRNYVGNGIGWRRTTAKTSAYTVVNGTDNNRVFTNQGAVASVTYTLPTTLYKGQRWRFMGEADFNTVVAAPAGKLVAFNNAAATSVALSTAGNKIGSGFEIFVNADATKYIAQPIGAGTVTVA